MFSEKLAVTKKHANGPVVPDTPGGAAAEPDSLNSRRRKWALLFMVAMASCGCDKAGANGPSGWTASISEENGLPVIAKDGRNAVNASYAFWGGDWSWANLSSRFNVTAPFTYSVTGSNKILDFVLNGIITVPGGNRISWEIDLDVGSEKPDAKGGVIFKFDLNAFGAEMGPPRLLPDNRGWTWGKAGASRLEMRFEPAVPALYFERGNKNELRAFFFNGSVRAGKRHYKMTLSLSTDVAVRPSLSERFGALEVSRWPAADLDWQASPVDLSFLNESEKPAGRRGFVRAVGESLVFQDGTQARFWGTNLTASALFETSRDNVRRQARRLSAMGFNLVRIHHHDSFWASPNIFGKEAASTRDLSADSLDKLDWWIKCLKDEGIYVWLDLHVQRRFTAGDQIDGFDEIRKDDKTENLKGYSYVNPAMQKAMKRFNEAYLNHVNAYTDVAYKNEPAIMGLLITNENDVTHHFGNALLPDKKVPWHSRRYMHMAEAFAAKTGLPREKTWRAWEPGPSKLFLNDLEYRFNADMISHLRALGVKAPIATTSWWGDEALFSLPALTTGDIIDVHAYGGALELEKNPLTAANMVNWLSMGQVAGKPISITEWNVFPFPIPDRHSSPLYIAGAARLQGWDAVMQYAYGQTALNNPGAPSNWHAFNDPSLVATLPAAALLYRQGHVREATTPYALSPGREQLFYQAISPDNSAAIRTASEKGKLIVVMPEIQELPWLRSGTAPPGAKIIHDLNQSMIDPQAAEATSDTGEIRRNWAEGIYTINTPRTQAAMGWIGDKSIVLPDVVFDVKTRNATVVVQSLDGAPIRQSSRLLISLGAQSLPSAGNRLPFRSEPVLGRLAIRAPQGMKPVKKTLNRQEKEIPAVYRDGKYVIDLNGSPSASWIFLR